MLPGRKVIGMRIFRRLLIVTCVLVALAIPAAGSATVSYGPKVSPSLAAVANASGATSTTVLHAIIFGSNIPQVNTDLGTALTVRQTLGTIGGESADFTVGTLPQLTAEPGVSWVTLDSVVVPTGAVTSPPIGSALVTTYPSTDNVTSAWQNGITGNKVGVAVIDSGVTPEYDFNSNGNSNNQLNGNRLQQVQLQGQQGGGGALNDPYGHGTFVAGVIGGNSMNGHFVGIAPGASIDAINVSRPSGVRTSDIIAGLLWVLAHHKDQHIGVVNLSLTETTASSYLTSPLDAVVELLWRSGVTVVVSSGNLGPGTTSYAPANDPFVITVGATDTTVPGQTTVASFSSSGNTKDGIYKPEIMAPGRRIGSILPVGTVLDGEAPSSVRLEPGYVRMSGTSFSAPQVTGAVALLLQQRPTLTPDQIKYLLTQNEDPVSGSPVGSLDIGAALAAPTPAVATAAQQFQPAQWGASAAPTVTQTPTPPPAPAVPTYQVPAPVAPTTLPGAPQYSVANPSDPKCTNCVAAMKLDATASATSTSNMTLYAQNWEKAAQGWEKAPSWANAAADWAKAAAAWDGSAAFDHGSNDWQKAATEYERSTIWDKMPNYGNAATAWQDDASDLDKLGNQFDKAAAAWDSAVQDFTGANDTADAQAAATSGAVDWRADAAAFEAKNAAPNTPSTGNWTNAAKAWDNAAADDAFTSGATTVDFANAASDYDSAAQIFQSAGNNQEGPARNAAALRYGAAAQATDQAGSYLTAASEWSAAQKDWQRLTDISTSNTQLLQQHANSSTNPSDWAKAAAAWDSTAAAAGNVVTAAQSAAQEYERAAAWDKGAAAWDKSAGVWDKFAAAWDQAQNDWGKAGNATNQSTDQANRAAAWDSEGMAEEQAGTDQLTFSTLDTANTTKDVQTAIGFLQSAAGIYQKAAA